MRQSSSAEFLAQLSRLSEVDRGSNISEIHRQAENPLERPYRRRPPSLNSITAALYTIHQRQRCTGCSFQLLFPQIPTEISFVRTMHFFTSEKRRKKINIWFQYMWKPINTLPGPPFLCSSSRSSLRLWPMVNRNNGEWLLGGQGAAGAANEAADESAPAGITRPLTPLQTEQTERRRRSEIQPRWRKNLCPSCCRPLGGAPAPLLSLFSPRVSGVPSPGWSQDLGPPLRPPPTPPRLSRWARKIYRTPRCRKTKK